MSARRRRTPLPLVAILIVLAGSSLTACGNSSNDSKLLSSTSALELRSTLAEVENMVEIGNCGAAQGQVSLLEQQVTSLDRVEADLRDALVSGVSRLEQLVIEKCQTTAETGTTGPAETGGTTAPDEQQSDEPGNSEGKGKGKKKGHFKDEDGGGGQQDEGGSGGEESGGGTTGSGGFAP